MTESASPNREARGDRPTITAAPPECTRSPQSRDFGHVTTSRTYHHRCASRMHKQPECWQNNTCTAMILPTHTLSLSTSLPLSLSTSLPLPPSPTAGRTTPAQQRSFQHTHFLSLPLYLSTSYRKCRCQVTTSLPLYLATSHPPPTPATLVSKIVLRAPHTCCDAVISPPHWQVVMMPLHSSE